MTPVHVPRSPEELEKKLAIMRQELREANETISLQHKLMVTAEQRGVSKGLEERAQEVQELQSTLDFLKKALKKCEFGCIDSQEGGWIVDGFIPEELAGYVNGLEKTQQDEDVF